MEGSLTLWFPDAKPLEKIRHPYQRTYKPDKKARWQTDEGYCNDFVKKTEPYNKGQRYLLASILSVMKHSNSIFRLLDIIDAICLHILTKNDTFFVIKSDTMLFYFHFPHFYFHGSFHSAFVPENL